MCSLEWTAGKGVLIILLRWFSNRTGTSVDDGARNQTTSLTNGRVPNWVAEVEFSPFRALSRSQITFSFCCQITLFLKPQWLLPNSELKQRRRRRRRQRERQKRNRYTLAKQQLCTCITLFCTFVCRHCTTTTWNLLISRFLEDVNARKRLSFSSSWTSIQSFGIHLQEKIANFWRIERDGISVIKFEVIRIHF